MNRQQVMQKAKFFRFGKSVRINATGIIKDFDSINQAKAFVLGHLRARKDIPSTLCVRVDGREWAGLQVKGTDKTPDLALVK